MYKLCSGSQHLPEFVSIEDDEKESQFTAIYGFLWSNGCHFLTEACVWMWSQSLRWWDCDVNGFTCKSQDVKGYF